MLRILKKVSREKLGWLSPSISLMIWNWNDLMRRCDGREIFYRPTKSTAPWITTFALRQSINIYMPSSSTLMLIQQGDQVFSLDSNISWLQPTFTILHFRGKKSLKLNKDIEEKKSPVMSMSYWCFTWMSKPVNFQDRSPHMCTRNITGWRNEVVFCSNWGFVSTKAVM